MCLSKGGALWCLENLEGEGGEWRGELVGVKRRKTGGGGRARGEFGEVINIQQLRSSEGVTALLPLHRRLPSCVSSSCQKADGM